MWQRVAGRLGKKRGYLISSLVLAAGCAGLLIAGRRTDRMVYVLAGVTGIGYAGAQLFPLAMLPDTAAHDARQTGENRVGVFTGVWTAGGDPRAGSRARHLRADLEASAAIVRPPAMILLSPGRRSPPSPSASRRCPHC